MNKYQEALNDMYAVLNDSNRWCERKSLLQELVDKETPMKPRFAHLDKINMNIYGCPNCKALASKTHPRCPNCGQKIDWSDDD